MRYRRPLTDVRVVQSDVHELGQEVSKVPKDFQQAARLLQEMTAAQEEFKTEIRHALKLLDQATEDSFAGLVPEVDNKQPPAPGSIKADPVLAALQKSFQQLRVTTSQVLLKLKAMTLDYKHDDSSLELYQLEHKRWSVVSSLTEAAWQYSQRHLPRGQALEWIDFGTVLTKLKDAHDDVYHLLDPQRERFIKIADDTATVELRKPGTKKPVRLTPTDLLKQLIARVLAAASLVATATVKTLQQYDEAKDELNEAKQMVQQLSGSPTRPITSQVIRFSGALYKQIS
jgi:DNA-binding ferritin-like protein